jgi:hypothetical protein
LDTVEELKPVAGVHTYELPVTAVEPMLPDTTPLQVVRGVTLALGSGLTVTHTLFDLLQPVAVIVSVSV